MRVAGGAFSMLALIPLIADMRDGVDPMTPFVTQFYGSLSESEPGSWEHYLYEQSLPNSG